ncbi:hypothetical protein ASE08_26855 [Rhizobacter sp. Root16D2]|nr:hypothetical protein ASC98_17765 [Rhizobacter sp. Root1238]KRB15758.1 hypothetical protein ASE08_26855 [Rhizobacter sp. Root16D2]
MLDHTAPGVAIEVKIVAGLPDAIDETAIQIPALDLRADLMHASVLRSLVKRLEAVRTDFEQDGARELLHLRDETIKRGILTICGSDFHTGHLICRCNLLESEHSIALHILAQAHIRVRNRGEPTTTIASQLT